MIEHLPSGNKKYMTGLEDILRFIRPYLEALGANTEEKPAD
jgi:hypothetical protein